ncbi:MAG: type II toxin-antitoxin system death-on-curing family toxin [Xenococcaceae cyanobacterium]
MPIPNFLNKSSVLRIHDRQIEKFGGTSGVRDVGLLESALSQPQATFGGQYLHATIYEQAAAYLYHLAMNHPFIDGNKRTAFAVMDTFLILNGYVLTLTDEEAYELVIQVVQGEMNKSQLASYLDRSIKSIN